MKVCIGTDLEGVAGVVSFESQAYETGKYFEDAKKLLTAEVNAAVEGMIEMGVDEILVIDGHGPGAIVFENLHSEAKLLHGRPLAPRQTYLDILKKYDVCMMIGQHAMAGITDGNLNHTQNSKSIEYYKLNDKFIGEIAQFALSRGAIGLPLIFLSGDDAACKEAEELIPQIITVSVKQGLGRSCAISLSAEKARQLIREGVKTALKKHEQNPVPPLKWEGPYVLEKRFFHTDAADATAQLNGAERIDSQTVLFRADDISEIIYR